MMKKNLQNRIEIWHSKEGAKMIRNKDLQFNELLYYWENEDSRPETKLWRCRLSKEELMLVSAWDKKFNENYDKYVELSKSSNQD